jgi:hypothetical protein
MNDGERTILAVKAAEGKRLIYEGPQLQSESILRLVSRRKKAVNTSNHPKKKASPGPRADRLS